MVLVNASKILADARRKKYGIPSLLAGNLEMIIGQIRAAEEVQAPIILAFNEGVTPKIPMELGMSMAVEAAKRATVPVATILDHGQSLETVVRAIQLGSSAVMFDGSHLPYAENVKQTQEVVRVARALGVDVEAELGAIGGSAIEVGLTEDDATADNEGFTDPGLAAKFVAETGIDILAISFGNLHGVYSETPNLELDRVKRIYDRVTVPLAMHGGSGLGESFYPTIIASGISKLGYYTAMALGAGHDIGKMMAAADQYEAVYHNIISRSIDYFCMETKRLLDILGCSGKAT
jgi:fructose-bisphosphate aldolase class II